MPIEDRDVRVPAVADLDRLRGVVGLGDHVEIRLALEGGANRPAMESCAMRDEYADYSVHFCPLPDHPLELNYRCGSPAQQRPGPAAAAERGRERSAPCTAGRPDRIALGDGDRLLLRPAGLLTVARVVQPRPEVVDPRSL